MTETLQPKDTLNWKSALTFEDSDQLTLENFREVFQRSVDREAFLKLQIEEKEKNISNSEKEIDELIKEVDNLEKQFLQLMKELKVPINLDSSGNQVYDYSKSFVSMIPNLELSEPQKAPKNMILGTDKNGNLNYLDKKLFEPKEIIGRRGILSLSDLHWIGDTYTNTVAKRKVDINSTNRRSPRMFTQVKRFGDIVNNITFPEEPKHDTVYRKFFPLNSNDTGDLGIKEIKLKKGYYLIEGCSISIGHRYFQIIFAPKWFTSPSHYRDKKDLCIFGSSSRNFSLPYGFKEDWVKLERKVPPQRILSNYIGLKYDKDLSTDLFKPNYGIGKDKKSQAIKEKTGIGYLSSISHISGIIHPSMFIDNSGNPLSEMVMQLIMYCSYENMHIKFNESVTPFQWSTDFNAGLGKFLISHTTEFMDNSYKTAFDLFSQLQFTQLDVNPKWV